MISSAHAQRELPEQRMLAPEADARSMKISYHVFSAVNRLPNEILCKIFLGVAQHSQKNEAPQNEAFLWIKVAHICRHWRAVTFECAELWSNILFINPELTELMLSLSKAVPISFEVAFTNLDFDAVLGKLMSQTARLRSVHISGKFSNAVLKNLSGSASALEKFVLKSAEIVGVELPDTFLPGGAPLLRHLELRQVSFANWSLMPLGPSITHLELRCSVWTDRKPSPGGMLSALGQMPSLETLALQRAIPRGMISDNTLESAIEFSALRRVELTDSMSCIHGLIRAIRIPPPASLSFTFLNTIDNLDALGRFSKNLAIAWLNGGRLTAKELFARALYSYMGDFLTLDFRQQCLDDHQSSEPALAMLFVRPSQHRIVQFLLTICKSAVDIASLVSFRIDSPPELNEVEWTETFGQLPQLERITFIAAPFFTFCNALTSGSALSTSDDGTGDSTTHIAFPALRTLSLEEIDLTFYNRYTPVDSATILVNALNSRPETHRITFLDIKKSEIFGYDAYNLVVTLVPHLTVSWDGPGREPGSDMWDLSDDEDGDEDENEDEGTDGEEYEDEDEGADEEEYEDEEWI